MNDLYCSRRALTRGQLLRVNSSSLPPDAFASIKSHLSSAYISGTYLKDSTSSSPQAKDAEPPNPLDPAAMDGLMDMVKKQAVGFLPQVSFSLSFFDPRLLKVSLMTSSLLSLLAQTVLMYYINSFFSGFLLSELHFCLSPRLSRESIICSNLPRHP